MELHETVNEITLLVGHGSRDEEGNAEFLQFVRNLTQAMPQQQFEACFLELAEPTIPQGIDACIVRGATRIVVVPVILLAASHVKLEIPEFLDAARKKYPQVEMVYGRNIGLHAQMIDLLTQRFEEQMQSASATEPMRAELYAETAIVLLGRGSSDPDANGDLYKIARQVWERTGVKTVEVCFTSITYPNLSEGVARAIALRAKRIVVVPYFLFTGVLIKRMTDALAALQSEHPSVQMRMADYFGMHPLLMEIVQSRQVEAKAGQAFMNCDLCKYRKLAAHEHGHDHHHDHDHGQNHDHPHHHDHHHGHHHDDEHPHEHSGQPQPIHEHR